MMADSSPSGPHSGDGRSDRMVNQPRRSRSKGNSIDLLLPSLAAQVEAQEAARRQHVAGNLAEGCIPPQYVALSTRGIASPIKRLSSGRLQSPRSSFGSPAHAGPARATSSQQLYSSPAGVSTQLAAAAGMRSTTAATVTSETTEPEPPRRVTHSGYAGLEEAMRAATLSSQLGTSEPGDQGRSSSHNQALAKTDPGIAHSDRENQVSTESKVTDSEGTPQGSHESDTVSQSPARARKPLVRSKTQGEEALTSFGSGSGSESDSAEPRANPSRARRLPTRAKTENRRRVAGGLGPPAGPPSLVQLKSIIRSSTTTTMESVDLENLMSGDGPSTQGPSQAGSLSRVRFDTSPVDAVRRVRLPSTGGALLPTFSSQRSGLSVQHSSRSPSHSASGIDDMQQGDSAGASQYVGVGPPSSTMNVVSAFAGFESESMSDSHVQQTSDDGSAMQQPRGLVMVGSLGSTSSRLRVASRGPGLLLRNRSSNAREQSFACDDFADADAAADCTTPRSGTVSRTNEQGVAAGAARTAAAGASSRTSESGMKAALVHSPRPPMDGSPKAAGPTTPRRRTTQNGSADGQQRGSGSGVCDSQLQPRSLESDGQAPMPLLLPLSDDCMPSSHTPLRTFFFPGSIAKFLEVHAAGNQTDKSQ